MDFLQKLGRRLVEVAPDKVALLTAGSGGEGFFVVAAGSQTGLDLATVGPEVAVLLEGRGGGARNTFQGKATGLANRNVGMEFLRNRAQAP